MAKEFFTSRWGLVMAALGMAVGTGNIWRFPRIAAKNGGGAFLIPWIIFLFLWSIPLLMAEFAIGKHTRLGTVGAFGKLIGRKFAWMGTFVGFCSTAIMFYYSVVMGWCVRYLFSALTGNLHNIDAMDYWTTFASSKQPILFHLIAMVVGAFIVYRGVVKGIERATKVLIPVLFFLIFIAAVRAITLPGGTAGLEFFFNPDWHQLGNYRVWLEALSQSAWSTGAGWGLVLTYAVYMRKNEDVALNSFITGLGNNSASILIGIMIFPTVFSLAPLLSVQATEIVKLSGPANTGMAFIWIPRLFEQLPGGTFFSIIFFLSLVLAALSSLIAMIELVTRVFMDAGMKRQHAILAIAAAGFLLGLPSALNMSFFENQDWVWGLGLIVSGFFFAIAIQKFGVHKFRMQLINDQDSDITIGVWYEWVIKYFIPIEFAVLITWWFYQAITIYAPNDWWNPLSIYSVGTTLLQWGLAIAVFILLNKWLTNKTLGAEV